MTILAISDDVWIAGISAIATVAMAYMAYKTRDISNSMKELTHNTNSIKDELVKAVGEREKAKGRLEGREDLLAEQKSDGTESK